MSHYESCQIFCALPQPKFRYNVLINVDLPEGHRLIFSNLEEKKLTDMGCNAPKMLDHKRYAIKKHEMCAVPKGLKRSRITSNIMNYDNLELMAGDKLEVTILPDVQSSMLISILWISCVIFITVLFTYTYTAIQELWWN